MIASVINTAENIFNRQRKIDDPIIRYSLFVDKLSMVLDASSGFLKGFTDDEKYPSDLRDRIDHLSNTIHKDLDDLMEWIRHPIYSPDHPYGDKIMDKSKDDFKSNNDIYRE